MSLRKTVTLNSPLNFQAQTLKRYVGDIFVTFTSHAQPKRFVNYMNKQRPNIKFTFEVEQYNTHFHYPSVYGKPAFSDVFTNFASFVPLSYKLDLHKWPSKDVLKKRCSEYMQQIYRRTPIPKCDFNIALRHGFSLANLRYIFRIFFSKNTSGGLLLGLVNTLLFRCFTLCGSVRLLS